jgi:hypothetical protein
MIILKRYTLALSTFPQFTDAAITGTDIEPGRKGRPPFRIEFWQRFVDIQKHFLADILTQMRITHESINEGKQVLVVLLNELGKRINVTVPDKLDYVIVVHFGSTAFCYEW